MYVKGKKNWQKTTTKQKRNGNITKKMPKTTKYKNNNNHYKNNRAQRTFSSEARNFIGERMCMRPPPSAHIYNNI